MTRIFIEEQELDLTKDFSQQTTYAVDDLTNLDSKATSFTKTIVLPGTANNNRLLGNIFEFNNSNFNANTGTNYGYNFDASRSAKVRMEINGLQVMKGVLRLLEVIIDGDYIEYEVALFGELGGFFATLGAKKLTDLDFSEYNHTYSIANITGSWTSPSGGTGYYYPLIDYGNVSPLTNVNFQKKNYYYTAFRPALFVRDYMRKIITSAGYTYESNFFDTSFFKSLIIPNNQKRFANNKTNVFYGSFSQQAVGNSTRDLTMTINFNDVFTTSDNITFTYNSATTFVGRLNYQFTGQFRMSTASTIGATATASIAIYKNGVKFGTYSGNDLITKTYDPSNNFTTYYSKSINRTISFQNGDTLKFVYEKTGANAFFESDPSVTKLNGGAFDLLSNNPVMLPIGLGEAFQLNQTLPANILQKDFFASILKMFNLMVSEDKYIEKKLIIEPYINFYDTNRTTFLDWSDKVDHSKPLRIKPMSEVNARYYEFKYKPDTDYYNDNYRKKWNEGYGDRIYDNALEFAKDKDTTEVIFAPTPIVQYSTTDKVVPAIYKYNNGAEESTEFIIRILCAKRITGVTSWNIYNAALTNLSTNSVYPYAGHIDHPTSPTADINFGASKELYLSLPSGSLSNNLFNVYYSEYFAEITDKDSRLVTCKMKLNEQDIFNLNFGKFVFIDGVLYRLIKITDYTEDDVCEVQLLRVINTTY